MCRERGLNKLRWQEAAARSCCESREVTEGTTLWLFVNMSCLQTTRRCFQPPHPTMLAYMCCVCSRMMQRFFMSVDPDAILHKCSAINVAADTCRPDCAHERKARVRTFTEFLSSPLVNMWVRSMTSTTCLTPVLTVHQSCTFWHCVRHLSQASALNSPPPSTTCHDTSFACSHARSAFLDVFGEDMLLARLRGEAPSTGAQKRVKTHFKCAACEGHGKRGLMTTGYFLLHKECPVCGGGGKNQEALKPLGPGKCTKCNAQGTRGLFTSRSCCFSFLCKPCAGSGFTQHYKLYHGTDKCTSEIIKQHGFRPSPDGMFGKGAREGPLP